MSKSNSSKAHQLGTADRQGEGSAGLRSEHGTAQRKTAYYKCGEIQETDVCKSAFYEKHYGEIVPKLTVEAEVTASLPWGERTEQGVGIWDTGATQSSIAKHFADKVGIKREHVSRIEAGKYSVGLKHLAKIAKALNTELDFM